MWIRLHKYFDPIVRAALTWVEHTQVHYWSYKSKDIYLFFCRTLSCTLHFANFDFKIAIFFYRSWLEGLRTKIWPKESQKFSKFKKFNILNEDKKDYQKKSLFAKTEKKNTSFGFFLAQKTLKLNIRNTASLLAANYVCWFCRNFFICRLILS